MHFQYGIEAFCAAVVGNAPGAGHLQMHTWEIISSLLIPTCGCFTWVLLNFIIFKTWL